jgi:hypothetical protein
MSLPLEVILVLSEQLLFMGRTNELAALSCLESRYSHAIQKVLFSHIELESYDRYERLMRALQPGDHPNRCLALSSMVRCLAAILNPRPDPGEHPFTPEHLLGLYDRLPKLERVSLAVKHRSNLGEQLIPAMEDLQRIGAFSTIRSLTLMSPFGFIGNLMLIGLPNLEELRLFGDAPVSRFTGTFPRSGQSLRRLTWGIATPPMLRHILWLFAGSNVASRGELVLLVPPVLQSELEEIRTYALRRGMTFKLQSLVAASPILEESDG